MTKLVQLGGLDSGLKQQLWGRNHLIAIWLRKILREWPTICETSELFPKETLVSSWLCTISNRIHHDDTVAQSRKNISNTRHHHCSLDHTYHNDATDWHHKRMSSRYRTHRERYSLELGHDRPHVKIGTNHHKEGSSHTKARRDEPTTITQQPA